MPRFHVLGSSGLVPTPSRQTKCHLLETRRSLILFDCGSGLSRLHDPMFQMLIARHTRALVLLAGWRLDQLAGLPGLPLFFGGLEVVVAAVPVPGDARAPARRLDQLTEPPFAARPFSEWGSDFPKGLAFVALRHGAQKVLGEEVQVAPLAEDGSAYGIRVRDVAYISGSPDPEPARAFADRAALLVHDALADAAGGALPSALAPKTPPAAFAAARLAERAQVSDLLLTGLNPTHEAMRLERVLFEASAVFPRTQLGSDMSMIEIRSALADDEEEAGAVSASGPVADGDEPDVEGTEAAGARTAGGPDLVEIDHGG